MPKINYEEYEKIKPMPDYNWNWIAREKDGKIQGFTNKPTKTDEMWKDKQTRLWFNHKDSELFQFIQWEDSEPHNIAELIEEYEEEEYGYFNMKLSREFEQFSEESEETEVKDIKWLKQWIEEYESEVIKVIEKCEVEGQGMKINRGIFVDSATIADLKFEAVGDDDELDGFITTLSRGKQSAIKRIKQKIDQLDEPEVLSQEWIDKHKEGIAWSSTDTDTSEETYYIKEEDLQNLFVPKQELPEIPPFVAKWIETSKHATYRLLGAVYDGAYSEDMKEWLFEGDKRTRQDNQDKLTRAWLDGFTVEAEQKYIVELPSEVEHDDMWPKVVLSKLSNGKLKVRKTSRQTNLTLHDKYLLTEKEIKDYEPDYWPFAKRVEDMEE